MLGLCDKMPALGTSMLPEAVRIQSFAVALEAAAGEAAHTSLRGEISAKGQLTLAEARRPSSGGSARPSKRARRRPRRPLPPTRRSSAASTPAGSLMSSWRRLSRLSAPMLRSSELPRQAVFKQMLRDFMSSGLASLPEAGLSALAGGPPMHGRQHGSHLHHKVLAGQEEL